MGIWIDSNGQSWDINMEGRTLAKMQRNPDFKFCWMKDSPGIDDESNLNFYHEETIGEQKGQMFNKAVTVNCPYGSQVSGKVYHWVKGPCCGTPLKNWFIICTKD
jgi:hypothetical protein